VRRVRRKRENVAVRSASEVDQVHLQVRAVVVDKEEFWAGMANLFEYPLKEEELFFFIHPPTLVEDDARLRVFKHEVRLSRFWYGGQALPPKEMVVIIVRWMLCDA